MAALVTAAMPALARPEIERAEEQRHGFVFENWVRATFFGGVQSKGYTAQWDIPAEANSAHGHIPANPKVVKYGSAIDLGDALRQFDIAQHGEPFLLIVGFWEQTTPTEKKFVNVQAVEVGAAIYRRLWGPITRVDLERLAATVKNKSLNIDEARKRAREIKSQSPFTESTIVVNPKIDASQRRLQCSLRFADFFRHLAPRSDLNRQVTPMLFGVPVPGPFSSPPRGGPTD
jgi:hypothetical protein